MIPIIALLVIESIFTPPFFDYVLENDAIGIIIPSQSKSESIFIVKGDEDCVSGNKKKPINVSKMGNYYKCDVDIPVSWKSNWNGFRVCFEEGNNLIQLYHSSDEVESTERSVTSLYHTYNSNPVAVGNHNPSFLLRGYDITVDEDSGAYLLGDEYAEQIDDNNNFSQAVRFKLTNSNEDLFDVQPHIIGCNQLKCRQNINNPTTTGALHFSVAPNRFGRALVEVIAIDDGIEPPVCDGNPLVMMMGMMVKCVPVDCDPALCTNSDPQYFWIDVIPANDPPSFNHKGDVTSPEDQPTCHDAWATDITSGGWGEDFMQQDAQPLTFTITNPNPDLFRVQPNLNYNQGDVTASLCYEPAPNKVGQATISIDLRDGGNPPLSFATQFITITIEEVNDPPTFTPLLSSVRVLEDSGAYSQLYSKDMVPGPPEEIDAGQRVQGFVITFQNIAQSGLFEKQPEIDPVSGMLSFTPGKNKNTFHQPVNLKVVLVDRVDAPKIPLESEEQMLSIDITPVNDPPSYNPPNGDTSIVVWEDEPLDHSIPWATQICPGGVQPNDCAEDEADPQGEAQVITFTLTQTDLDQTSDPPLYWKPNGEPRMDSTGHVNFEILPDKVGETFFTVEQRDSGAAPNSGPVHSLVIKVMPVNDPPMFILSTETITLFEDSSRFELKYFLKNITKGPAEPDENSQTIRCWVTVDKPELFHPLQGEPVISLDLADTVGHISLIPAPNQKGAAECTVTCQDSGGTVHGGDDTTTSTKFSIIIKDVSDPPTFTVPTAVIVDEDSAPFGHILPNTITNITAGFNEDGAQSVRFEVTTYDLRLFENSGLPQISPDGTLQFQLKPNINGNSLVDVVAIESVISGPEVNTSDPFYVNTDLRSNITKLNITVLPVDDPPIISFNTSTLKRDAQGVIQPFSIQTCMSPDTPGGSTCTVFIMNLFKTISVGPLDETSSSVISQTADVSQSVGLITSAEVTGFVIEPHPAAYLGHNLRITMPVVRDTAVLPEAFTLNLTVTQRALTVGRDAETLQNVPGLQSSTLVPIRLYHPVIEPTIASRLMVIQQPELNSLTSFQSTFQLQNSFGTPILAEATITITITNIQNSGTSPLTTLTSDGTPQSDYLVSGTGLSAGVYFLDATAVLFDIPMTTLTVRSDLFTIGNRNISYSTYLNSIVVSSVSEHQVRTQLPSILSIATASNGVWNQKLQQAVLPCSLYTGTANRDIKTLYANEIVCTSVLQGGNSRLAVSFEILDKNNAFNIDSDSSLAISLPTQAVVLSDGSFDTITTPIIVAISRAPVIAVVIPEPLDTQSIRKIGQKFYVNLQKPSSASDKSYLWRLESTSLIKTAITEVTDEDNSLFNIRKSITLTANIKTNDSLEVLLGPDDGFYPQTGDVNNTKEEIILTLLPELLIEAIENSQGVQPEYIPNSDFKISITDEMGTSAGEKSPETEWVLPALLLGIVSLCCGIVAGAVAGGIASTVPPVLVAALSKGCKSHLAGAIGGFSEGTSWMLNILSINDKSYWGNLIIALGVVLIHLVVTGVVKLIQKTTFREASETTRFPSATLPVIVVLAVGVIFGGPSSIAGAICAVVIIAALFGVWLLIFKRIRQQSPPHRLSSFHNFSKSSLYEFEKTDKKPSCTEMPFMWLSTYQFGFIYQALAIKNPSWLLIDLACLVIVIPFIAGWAPTDRTNLQVQTLLVAIILIVWCVSNQIFNVRNTRLTTVLLTVVYLLISVGVLMLLLSHAVSDESDVNPPYGTAAAVMFLLALIVHIVSCIIIVYVLIRTLKRYNTTAASEIELQRSSSPIPLTKTIKTESDMYINPIDGAFSPSSTLHTVSSSSLPIESVVKETNPREACSCGSDLGDIVGTYCKNCGGVVYDS